MSGKLQKKKQKNKKKQENDDVSLGELVAAQDELSALQREHNIGEKEGPISHAISAFFNARQNREKRLLSKKTYILLLVFTGWIGGHRYYAHRWILAVLYTALFWTGFPLAMSIIDLMEVIPIPANDHGQIEL